MSQTTITTPNGSIDIVDNTDIFKNLQINAIVTYYLRIVPDGHLRGIARICLYDDKPGHFPNNISAGYYAKGMLSEHAEIALFLAPIFGVKLTRMSTVQQFMIGLFNRWFLFIYGRLFLAAALFHEVGHHRLTVISSSEASNLSDAERYANEYEKELLWKAHPFIYKHYDSFDKLYRILFGERIRQYK